MDIQPQLLTLARLFEGRLFYIPDYQRSYSWSSRERKDLFDDIRSAGGKEEGHFMATLVCLRRTRIKIGIDEYQKLDIVDGQQRLTTLVILLNAIRLAMDPDDKSDSRAASGLRDLLVKPASENLLLLQTNHDSSHYFSDYLYEGETHQPDRAKTIADRELLSAIQDCTRFVRNCNRENADLAELAAVIRNRLSFVLHEISDEKTVYTVFEVLNSRGMPVSWLDRLKTALMGAAFGLSGVDKRQVVSDLHNVWRETYRIIGLRQGLSTESLRFAATLRVSTLPSRPLGEQAAVDELRLGIDTPKHIREVGRWLLKVTEACDKIHRDSRRNAVTQIAQARLLAVAIELKPRLRRAAKDELLGLWESVVFRIYGLMGRDARTSVGDFVRLAWRIVNERMSFDEMAEEIVDIGADFPISQAIRTIRGTNCYEGWEDHLRYFMARYEEHLADEYGIGLAEEIWEKIWSQNASRSIEHVWSQSSASDDVKHNLGNLVLLPPGLNSKLQDKRPKEKFDAYRKTGLHVAGEVADVGGWSKRAIRSRESRLLRWASQEWA